MPAWLLSEFALVVGNPGPWTAEVLKDISREFNVDLAVLLGPQHGHQVRHQHPEGRGAHQTLKVDGGPVAKRGLHQLE